MWLNDANKILKQKLDFVIISIITTKGSTPCCAGDKMLLTKNQTFGSIGGGNLEYKTLQHARQLLNKKNKCQIQNYSLGASLGQCCGGFIKILFQCFVNLNKQTSKWLTILTKAYSLQIDIMLMSYFANGRFYQAFYTKKYQDFNNYQVALPISLTKISTKMLTSKNTSDILYEKNENYDKIHYCESFLFSKLQTVVIFGAGHIARALIPIISNLPVRLYWVDAREFEFSLYKHDTSNINIICDEAVYTIDKLAENAYYVVVTHSHQLDFEICEKILKSTNFNYLGLIGSQTKAKLFKKRLLAKGVAPSLIKRLICPIGKQNFFSKSATVTAVAIATSLIDFLEKTHKQKINK